jgi:hypothetical protein
MPFLLKSGSSPLPLAQLKFDPGVFSDVVASGDGCEPN